MFIPGKHQYYILRIRINADTKFEFKLTILILWTNFAQ